MALTNKMIGVGASGEPAYLRAGDGALIGASVQHLTDASGNDLGPVSSTNGVPFANSAATPSTANWTSATALNTALSITTNTLGCIAITIVNTATVTGGVIQFEAYDGAAWIPVRIGRFDTNQSNSSYALASAGTGVSIPWGDAVSPYTQFRVRLSTQISGGGTCTIAILNNSANVGTTSTVAIDSVYNQVQLSNYDTGALITAAAATSTQTGADQTNLGGTGIIVVLDMTSVGTGSVTLTIQGKDTASGKYYTLLAGAAVITNSTNVYTIFPGATAATNVTANGVLPKTWRVLVTANNANPTTYTVGASVTV